MSRLAAATLMTFTLASCGGGGDGGGNADIGAPVTPAPAPTPAPSPSPSPPPSPAPAPAPAPAPVASTGQYRLEAGATSNDAAVARMNSLGQEGYAFVGSVASTSGNAVAIGDLYVKDTARTATRLQYRTAAPATGATAILAQLNAQGAAGFAYKSDVAFFPVGTPSAAVSLFVTDTSKSSTYAYETQPSANPMARAALLSQLNAQGARGFRFSGPYLGSLSQGDFFNLYAKDSASGANFAYSFFDDRFASGADLQQRLTAQGAQGLLYRGPYLVDNLQTSVQMYEKRSTQSGAIEYRTEARASGESLQQTLARLNAQAAQGYFYLGDFGVADGSTHTIYVKNAVDVGNPLSGPVFP
ncbi:hypothetical protein ACFX58_18185 [Sphingomonas sp. NCPPB 2930]